VVEDILAAGEVQTLGALQVHLVVGLKVSADQLPDRSIALDGFVQGPVYLPQRKAWSFDHHGDCVRHATLSTCEQVRDALAVGFDPSGYHVFLNDIDADSVLSLWLLLHPDRLRGKGRQRLLRLIARLGRHDALGPAIGQKHPLAAHLKLSPGTPASLASLGQVLERLDAWWSGALDLPPRRASKVSAMWVDEGSLHTGPVFGGFAGLFKRAAAGIVYTAAPGGSYSYTVAKRSEFESFDVPLFLRTCAEREPGWGGASTTGGGPRHPDGSRSRLEPEEVGAIFLQAWLASSTG